MPRRQFVADLAKTQTTSLPLGVSDIKAGDDDGQVEFLFHGAGASGPLPNGPVKITAMVPDLGDYPKSHDYMIFADDNAPREVSKAISEVRGTSSKTVFEMIEIVSATLTRLDRDGDSMMPDSQPDAEMDDSEDEIDTYGSDHEAFEEAVPAHTPAFATSAPSANALRRSTRAHRQRIRMDLRAVKAAGFKVGHLGHLLDGFNAYVTVSIRIAKLGISEEAMQAWQVEPTEYLILIIQYPNGYKTNEELQGFDALRLPPNLCMRVVAGKKYKPTLQEAIKAFTVVKRQDRSNGVSDIPGPENTEAASSVRETFISKPLASLLQERLVPILRFRSAAMSWTGAEDHWRDQASNGTGSANSDIVPDKYFAPEPRNEALPEIVNADHYTTKGTLHYSFPLLAMQFVLRHFVRCTEFCLVCHRKLETDVEAIKPYVCDDSLCLYQYMTLGFGPSIEHELLAQPYVVDLLISFCYSSAAMRKLKDFPDGLSIIVPPVDKQAYDLAEQNSRYYGVGIGRQAPSPKPEPSMFKRSPKYVVGFDQSTREIIFFDKSVSCPVRRGSWIILSSTADSQHDYHCRVSDTTFFPTITFDKPTKLKRQLNDLSLATKGSAVNQTPASTRPTSPANGGPNWIPATFVVYDQDFGQLDSAAKCLSICKLLETLPSVHEMKEYLTRRDAPELRNWTERISSSALSLLRWIIASNRACIMQVDGGTAGQLGTQERCYGMTNHMQFRFAMGAPDKEQRFISEVRKETTTRKLKHPTIFAWHGSPLHNWHMIIREGLHYKNVDNGRAYGDGVYHAKDAQTSGGYSGRYSNINLCWPSSVLNISSAIALNEIVNAPEAFTSQNPFYVVPNLSWIQTRYLFVQVSPGSEGPVVGAEKEPTNPHPQDPNRTPSGTSGQKVIIPASAIKSGKKARCLASAEPSSTSINPFKKLKMGQTGSASKPISLDDNDDDDDTHSIMTDSEDREMLIDEPPEPPEPTAAPLIKAKKREAPKTDFVPGTLDFSSLPIMPLPTYATSGTTKQLMKELQALLKVQDNTPPAELGWYIDGEKIENVYQWIVELHSFHTFEVNGKPLPLASEMKKQNVKSIVLEIRFNKDFPFTPPYVRVIRPRCLSLAQGGGGHIVLGGALCMELLTNTGWSSVSSMESVLMQIRLAIASDPPARLDMSARKMDYGTGEAADGYIRACQTHGWQVPDGFKEMAYGSTENR